MCVMCAHVQKPKHSQSHQNIGRSSSMIEFMLYGVFHTFQIRVSSVIAKSASKRAKLSSETTKVNVQLPKK